MNPEVDRYIDNSEKWREEMKQLRAILLDCGLTEELKWGQPCYTFQGSNIAIIQPFKETCALMFFKGVLLDDPEGVLEKPGEHSRVARRIPFTGVEEITGMETVLKAYIGEAVEVEKAGEEVELEENPEPVPEELRKKMDENSDLKAAFEELTPGRRRGYILYISGARRPETRERRVEKYIPKILDGKGLNER